MEQRFDLRVPEDRRRLASHLSTFDGRTFAIPAEPFCQGLAYVAEYLSDPDWLTYQWGILGPLRSGKHLLHLDLERIVLLGHELKHLSSRAGFSVFLSGFSNPSQFHDSMFESSVASIFSRLNSTSALVFAPEHTVRGHTRRPEFDLETAIGPLSVECKQRHPDTHTISERIRTVGDALACAMDAAKWPDHLRLEVQLTGPIREQTRSFAARVVEAARAAGASEEPCINTTAAKAYVLSNESRFRLTKIQAGFDRMIVPGGKATGLFNPQVTSLRVASGDLDNRIAVTVGAQIRSALAQLPEDRLGIIALGDVPIRIAIHATDRRIDTPAYDRILAFAVFDEGQVHFLFREQHRRALETLIGSGMQPLGTAG